jgi:hypothetical protein
MAVWGEARTMPGLRVPGTHFCAAGSSRSVRGTGRTKNLVNTEPMGVYAIENEWDFDVCATRLSVTQLERKSGTGSLR